MKKYLPVRGSFQSTPQSNGSIHQRQPLRRSLARRDGDRLIHVVREVLPEHGERRERFRDRVRLRRLRT